MAKKKASRNRGSGGRALKFDDTKQQRYLDLIRAGCNRSGAAELCGVSRTTIATRRNEDEEFARLESESDMVAVAAVESFLYREAKKGNVTAQIFFLKNRAPALWMDRKALDMTVDTKQSYRVVVAAQWQPETLFRSVEQQAEQKAEH